MNNRNKRNNCSTVPYLPGDFERLASNLNHRMFLFGDALEILEPQYRVESLLLSFIEDVKHLELFRIEKGNL